MATAQQCHAMTTYYFKAYKDVYGREPIVNRNTARWGFDGILKGMPPAEAQRLIDFYLTTASSNKHSLEWFFYNYDKLIISQRETEEDSERRARLRAETKQRAEEWRASGHKGIGDA